MPSYVVKPSPDSDQYVWWSDVIEAPKAIGDRAYIQAVMRSWNCANEAADERFDRADKTGCSALWPKADKPIYGWDDTGLVAEQRGVLPRARLAQYAELRLADDPAAYSLLEPFEDCDEVRLPTVG